MKYIHAICRKQTPTEIHPLDDMGNKALSIEAQKQIICEYISKQMGFKVSKKKGAYRISNNPDIEIVWHTDYRGSGNSKFGESTLGIKLFKKYKDELEERRLRFDKGDILITPSYSLLFGDHPRHTFEVIWEIIHNKKGRFISCDDIGEVKENNKEGKILFAILKTMSVSRWEKTREINRKSKRKGKGEGKFLGGPHLPFGMSWKTSTGELSKLTPKDRKVMDEGKPEFGSYINASGGLVPHPMEQEAIREMKLLRDEFGMSYMKISKQIEKHFGTNKETGKPNIKISHMGIYRILNPTKRATKRK
jgi:hypothetical protein